MMLYEVMQEFIEVFERLDCPYVVMGGLAVRVYGIPRPTQDVDFTVSLPRFRLAEFYSAVESTGYTVPETYRSGWVDQVAGMPVVKLRRYSSEHGVDIDLFLAESKFQDSVVERRAPAFLDGIKVWMVSPEDLILLKLLAGRQRDLADVGDVLFTQGDLDAGYMRRWAEELGISKRLERALTEREF